MSDAEEPQRPIFFSTKTLLDGSPDTNRRQISVAATFEQIAELNYDMDVWTEDHQAVLRFLMTARDSDALRRRVEIVKRARIR